MGRKEPRKGAATSPAKVPRSAVRLVDKSPATLPQAQSTRRRPSWRFGLVDQDGPWPLSACTGEEMHDVVDKLRSFESMTCPELERNGETLKHYAVEDLPTAKAAQRLVELRLDDQTRISRLRLAGKPRLYGFMDDDSTFHIVWWDPEHEVWPSTKRNT